MKKSIIYYLLTLFCLPAFMQAQSTSPPDWNAMMTLPHANYYTIKAQVSDYFTVHPPSTDELHEETEGNALSYTNFQRWSDFWENRVTTGDVSVRGQFGSLFESYRNMSLSTICPGSGPYVATWTLMGPNNMPNLTMGIVNTVQQDPSNSSIIYAGTYTSGLWKTIDGGVNWVCKTDGLRYPGMGVMEVQIDQATPSTIFIATGGRSGFGAGVFKSTNGGNTWISTGLSFTPSNQTVVQHIRIDPTNSNIVYAMTYYDLFRSTDGGITWASILPAPILPNCWLPLQLEDIEILPANPNVIFISQSNPNICNTGGVPISKGQLVGSTWTWTNITPAPVGAGGQIEHAELAISAASPNSIFAIYNEITSSSNTSYRSIFNNTSTTWTTPAVNSEGPVDFKVSPTDVNVMYIGGMVASKTTNGGATWTSITNYAPDPYSHGDVRVVTLISGSTAGTGGANDKLYLGTDGGVTMSTNGGSTWTGKNGNGLAITQFYGIGSSDLAPNIFPGGTQDNGVYTYNFGTWSNVIVGDAYDAEIDKTDPSYMYVLANGWYSTAPYGYNYICRSSDYGLTWNPISQPYEPCLTVRPIQMNSVDNKLYVGYHNVYECANPRATTVTWTALSNFTGAPANDAIRGLAVAPSDPNVIYASFDRKVWGGPITGLFYKTTNHGASWTDIGVNLGLLAWYTITDIAVDQYNTSRLWVTIDGLSSPGVGKVMYSGDGGNTWSDYSTGLPDLPTYSIVYEKGTNDGLYVGNDAGVFYRNATMSQWECYSNNLPITYVYDLEINYAKNTLRAGTFGRGVWESNLACPTTYNLTLTGATSTSTFNEVHNQIISDQQITGGTILYRAGNSILLNPGFSATTSSYFSAYIHPCDVMGNSPLGTRALIVSEDGNADEEQMNMQSNADNSIKIYPNPNEGVFTIDLGKDSKKCTVMVYNLIGEAVAMFPNTTESQLQVDISGLSKGIYTVKVVDGKGVKTAKIISK